MHRTSYDDARACFKVVDNSKVGAGVSHSQDRHAQDKEGTRKASQAQGRKEGTRPRYTARKAQDKTRPGYNVKARLYSTRPARKARKDRKAQGRIIFF